MKATVVGAGISGLPVAYLLKKYKYDVTVLEKDAISGKAKTAHKDGYTIETGPNGFLSNKQEILKLVEISHFEGELIESNQASNRKFIYSGGKLWEVPKNPAKLIFSNFLTFKARLSILKEPFVKPIPKDETVEQFVTRRLGKEFLDKIIGPMVCGIFAGDPRIMSMESNFPRIKEIEKTYGSLIKGLIQLMKEKKAKASSVSGSFSSSLMSFKNGVEDFSRHLARGLTIIQDEAINLEKTSTGWKIIGKKASYESDIVVFAIPAYALSMILKNTDKELSSLLNQIPYAPLAVQALGFDAAKLPDVINSFGYLFDLNEIQDTIGVLFDSSVFEHRAPENKVLVRLMIGGQLAKDSPFKSNLIEIAVKELQRSAKIFKPFESSYTKVHPKAIPIYTMEHKEIVKRIKDFEKTYSGIFITGNAFYGVGLNDCVKSAFETVEKIKGGP